MALDLGKYKTVFCDYNSINGEHEFGKVKTTPQEIHDLIVSREPDRVVLEVCSIAGCAACKPLDRIASSSQPFHHTACPCHSSDFLNATATVCIDIRPCSTTIRSGVLVKLLSGALTSYHSTEYCICCRGTHPAERVVSLE